MRYTKKRNGVAVLPLFCDEPRPQWKISGPELIHRYLSGDAADKLAAYEDTGFEPEEIKRVHETLLTVQKNKTVMWNDLQKYLQAEAEGRLVMLPCKAGDTVWVVDRGEILKEKVIGFNTFRQNDGEIVTAMTTTYRDFLTQPKITYFGKLMPDNRLSFFLTCEEAEAALKGEKEDV